MVAISRRALGGAAALAAGALLGACSAGAGSGSAASSTDVLRVGLSASPASLDLTQTAGVALIQALVGNVYEGLVRLDNDGAVGPLLATSWTMSEDGLSYDFTLRPGVVFHDGTPFTAEHVKFSLERLGEWNANSPTNLAALDHVDVLAEDRARLVLSEPDHSALFWLAGPLGIMLTPDSVSTMATQCNGTGPFRMAGYERGVRLVLTRHGDYWGPAAGVARANLLYYADATAAANALRTGGVDVLYQAEAYDQITALEEDPDFTLTQGTTQGVTVMTMNSAHPPFDDPAVRTAVIQAIDRDAIRTAAVSGFGTVLGGPTVPTDGYYEDLADVHPYDPDAARSAIKAAGAAGARLTFTVPTRPYARAIAQVVQQQLAYVGLTVVLQEQEFPAVWIEKTLTGKDFDLTVVNHAESRNVTSFANPDYYWGLDDPEVTTLFAEAKAATRDAVFNDAMKRAARRIVADAPCDWLYNPPNLIVAAAGVLGFAANDMGVGMNLAGVTKTA